MPFKAEQSALLDMLDNAVLAQSFVQGMDIEGFRQDRRTFYAVVRCLEIISEASRNLGDDLKGRHAGLDWRAIAGSGNIYRHNYDNVGPDLIWRTVTQRMNEIIDLARFELSRLDG